MLRIHFTGDDLRKVTMADGFDPLWEVLLSLHMVQEPDHGHLAFSEWRRTIRPLLRDSPPLRMLTELARPWGYSPDFLTPGRGNEGFEAQLDRVLTTPHTRLRMELSQLAEESPPSPWTRALGSGDPGALRQLGDAMVEYHRRALLPYEGAMRAHAEADRARQARAILGGGVDRLLSQLHPRVVWEAPVLQMPVYADQDIHLGGRGIVLVPSYFCRIQPITLMDGDQPPVLVYPISPPLGRLIRDPMRPGHDGSEPVVALLGRTRAAVLEAAARTGTTTELAGRVGVAPPVVSRHTAVLRKAGLLETHREGGAVRHRITALGIALLNGDLPD
ncbi:ArsR/SmtB family transcription factor [Streptomyces yaizuensis]|uniref:Winged helix-turn-helix domain-containing protein n=1 Tax=Streptomyces yaizuensis TaxID=2989713 RepID=A0ABQ5NZK1_9ACTN|nr:winged helix-turn-helix domain-containing protein [Streptomyces sp. YSPA8]GLF95391.1 winged helix-turn-helix domain-containing protein [Streptomyces sp. YSPA8]